jgi:acyl carrier protein
MNSAEATAVVVDALGEIAPEVDLDAVDHRARLRDEVDLDSLDFLNLVQRIHDRTGVDIPETDYAQVESLDGLVGYLTLR